MYAREQDNLAVALDEDDVRSWLCIEVVGGTIKR